MPTPALMPVARRSLESQAIDALREFIISGEITPGTRVTETELAEQIGVARATVRTVLSRLADEGLVIKVPYTGWHVVQLTPQAVWEIWTLRGGLESLAARLVVQQGRPDVLDRVRHAHGRLAAACARGDVQDISERDFDFHRSIVEGCGNQRLIRQYQLVAQQVRMYIRTSNAHVATGADDILAQHAPIAAAMAGGVPDAAAQAAWLHNEQEGQRLLAWMELANDE